MHAVPSDGVGLTSNQGGGTPARGTPDGTSAERVAWHGAAPRRIAVVHDWLVDYSGSERVLEQLLWLLPEADLCAVVDFVPEAERAFLGGRRARTTFVQRLPFARTRYRSYLPMMPLAIEQLDLSGYDLVVSSSHAVAKGVLTDPDAVHVCYCHTPIRYAWDLQHEYLFAPPGWAGGHEGW